jgi:Holliday junction resolvase-like predicted endonuclease
MKNMQTSLQVFGQCGEGQAELNSNKNESLDFGRNHKAPYGEMDHYAIIDGQLVFIEVKARSSAHAGFLKNQFIKGTRSFTRLNGLLPG